MNPDRRASGPWGWVQSRWEAMGAFLSEDVWSKELGALPRLRSFLYRCARILYLTAKGLEEDRCLMRASALTFITGLSIVPLLAFAFAIAKGLGAYDALLNDLVRPFLDQHLSVSESTSAGSGVEVRAAIDQMLNLVKDTNVSSLGTFGLAILAYTAVKLLGSIEQTMNEIWGVQNSRGLLRRVSDYLSIILIVPILLTTATAFTTSLQNERMIGFLGDELGLGSIVAFYARFSSLIAVWAGFTILYLFMPNTKVRVSSAMIGGLAGGLLWQGAQLLHLRFQVGVANYNAIYSTFAALPIFMFWLYVSWTTVLLGAEVACAHQSEPTFRQIVRSRKQDHGYLQVVTVRVLTRVSVAFLKGVPPLRVGQLAQDLVIPERSAEKVVQKLVQAGIVFQAEEEEYQDIVLPARDPTHISIQDALNALAGDGGDSLPARDLVDVEADRYLERYRSDRRSLPANLTFRQLAERCIEAGSEVALPEDPSPVVEGS